MAMRLLLEGTDIDALLERVKDEHGPDAQIVHAEQKLVGGLGGFFARRRFEVTVEVGTHPPTDAAAVAGPGAAAPARPGGTTVADVLALLPEVPPAGGVALDPIELLLARANSQDGAADRPATPTAAPALDGPPAPAPAVIPTAPRGFAAALASAAAAPTPPAFTQATPTPPASTPPASTPAETSTGAATTPASAAVVPAPAGLARASEAALRELGVPASLLVRSPLSADPRLALLQVLEHAAAPAPQALRGVVAVVGPADAAGAVAAAVVRRCALDAGALLGAAEVAGATVACPDPVGALDTLVRGRLRAHGTVVVVLEADGSRAGAARASSTCRAIGAGRTVAVLDATRSLAVLRQWVQAFEAEGGALDEVAAFDLAEQPQPAAVLGLHRPVTWLDAVPATVGAWARLCLDRMLPA